MQDRKQVVRIYLGGKTGYDLEIAGWASYLDMFLWWNIYPDHAREIARKVMHCWIYNDEVIKINFLDNMLGNATYALQITLQFASKRDVIISGILEALDGWIVAIKCPEY